MLKSSLQLIRPESSCAARHRLSDDVKWPLNENVLILFRKSSYSMRNKIPADFGH